MFTLKIELSFRQYLSSAWTDCLLTYIWSFSGKGYQSAIWSLLLSKNSSQQFQDKWVHGITQHRMTGYNGESFSGDNLSHRLLNKLALPPFYTPWQKKSGNMVKSKWFLSHGSLDLTLIYILKHYRTNFGFYLSKYLHNLWIITKRWLGTCIPQARKMSFYISALLCFESNEFKGEKTWQWTWQQVLASRINQIEWFIETIWGMPKPRRFIGAKEEPRLWTTKSLEVFSRA